MSLRRHLRIVHHVPGRLRIRFSKDVIRTLLGDRVKDFTRLIESAPAVRHLRVSPVTLSAVIEYDHRRVPPTLWHSLIDGPEDACRSAFETLTRPD